MSLEMSVYPFKTVSSAMLEALEVSRETDIQHTQDIFRNKAKQNIPMLKELAFGHKVGAKNT